MENDLQIVKSELGKCVDEDETAQIEETKEDDTVSEENTEWLTEELTALSLMQKKINIKFKRDIPDLLLSESNATQVSVDELYSTLYTDTLNSVGS